MNESPTRYRIMLVEDDEQLGLMIAEFLEPNGFDVAIERRGDVASPRILHDNPDAVILDINLPGLDGFSICRNVRDAYRGTIMLLTARGGEVDEVLGLECGADDYMAKPVRPRALLARLRVHLKRVEADELVSARPIVVGSLKVDPSRRSAELDGRAWI